MKKEEQNISHAKLHSKAHRGGDKEPTQAYTEVRRGARRGDNKGGPMKATRHEESFVIYDPDNPPFERLYLCQYLLELPDLEEEDDPKTD